MQIDEVLAALQSDTREELKGLLAGYGTALNYEPTRGRRRRSGAHLEGQDRRPGSGRLTPLRRPRRRGTAIVNEALLGKDEHDLSGLIRAQRDVFKELGTVESELQGLITAFNTTAGALAQEQDNVRATIRELGPTLEAARPSLANLNEALPPFRAYVLALEPGVAELPDLIEAATPWLDATDELLAQNALGGLAEELRRGAPVTAEATKAALPLMSELSDLSPLRHRQPRPDASTPSITVDPNIPAAESQPAYLDFLDSAVNTSGAAANFDGNGSYLRSLIGGGDELTQMSNPAPTPGNNLIFGNTIEPVDGTQPALPADHVPPPYEPNKPCHKSDPADLNGPAANVGAPLPALP